MRINFDLPSQVAIECNRKAIEIVKVNAISQFQSNVPVRLVIDKSFYIIEVAKIHKSLIILEDLKHIRKNVTVDKAKLSNYEKISWAYYQLKEFVKHKASLEGIQVIEINPYNDSPTKSSPTRAHIPYIVPN
ncbi:MAG: IS200/IS605 family accessory protein TnpB-related protein [Halanaerobiales bacterium]|nr:IS200/IS605 family accessory protein TnpB-related protein [Halanaerobiales bacterium]